MSVNGPSMTGSTSFITRILTLSGPGDLLEGIDFIIRCISAQETGEKLKVFPLNKGEFLSAGISI